jgi:hypothetical protein
MKIFAKDALDHFFLMRSKQALLTKIQVSWSPIALCKSAAVTDESTPPLSPNTTFLISHLLPDPLASLFDERAHRPIHRATANVKNKILENLFPARCMRYFGMEL